MDSEKRIKVFTEYSKDGCIDWNNEWKIKLLTKELDINSLVALSLNRTPKILALDEEIKKAEIQIDQEDVFIELCLEGQKLKCNNSFSIITSLESIKQVQQEIKQRFTVIKPHLEKLDAKPVEINGISTVKCDIASFVALLVYLDLPHPKELDDYAVEYAGSLKSFREIVQQLATPENINTDKNKSNNTTKTVTPENWENLSNVQLVPYVMKSLGLDPLAYTREIISKKDIYDEAKKLYDKKFRMNFESFGRGGKSTWSKAKKDKLIREK